MKFFMPLILATLFLTGCNAIDGQLNISKSLTLVNSKGDKQTIEVGTYTAKVQSSGTKTLTLSLNRDQSFVFKIPKGSKIPSNGTFMFHAKDIGQSVDLAGTVATTSNNGPVYSSYLQCSYQQAYQICTATPQGQVCTIQYRVVYGNQWTQYYDRVSHQDVTLNLLDAGATTQAAEFVGNVSWSDRVVLSQSSCM